MNRDLWDAVHLPGCGINIINRCPYTVTTCAQSNRDQQFKGKLNQYNLGAGQSQYLDFGSSCVWRNGAVWPSVRGKCESAFVPNEANDWDVTNWAELNLNANGLDYYDVSNVVRIRFLVSSFGVAAIYHLLLCVLVSRDLELKSAVINLKSQRAVSSSVRS